MFGISNAALDGCGEGGSGSRKPPQNSDSISVHNVENSEMSSGDRRIPTMFDEVTLWKTTYIGY
jgi:hypothetical protein